MPTTCAVYHCPSPRGLTYHVFPSDPKQASLWAGNWTKRKVLNFRNARICSNHFKESDYKRDLRNELLGLPLRKIFVDPKNVVPTLNLSPIEDYSDESDDGLHISITSHKALRKAFKRKSTPDNIETANKVSRVIKEEDNIVEIFEYSPDIGEMEAGVDEVAIRRPSEDTKRLHDSSFSPSDSEYSDPLSDLESIPDSHVEEDPHVLIAILREKLRQKNNHIRNLQRKLKKSQMNKDQEVQFVYVQNLQTNELPGKEKQGIKIICDKS